MAITSQEKLNDRANIRRVYLGEVGVREATGKNDGPDVAKYLKSTKLPEGYAWCAAFVTWCFIDAGITAERSAWSPDWFRDATKVTYRKSHIKSNYKAKTGQVFGLYYTSLKRVAHVGFIDYEDKDNYYTVEGNTNAGGNREGDGVYKKIRPKKSIYIISDYVTEK